MGVIGDMSMDGTAGRRSLAFLYQPTALSLGSIALSLSGVVLSQPEQVPLPSAAHSLVLGITLSTYHLSSFSTPIDGGGFVAALANADALLVGIRSYLSRADIEAARRLAADARPEQRELLERLGWAEVLQRPAVSVAGAGEGNASQLRTWLRTHGQHYVGLWVAIDSTGQLIDSDASRGFLVARLRSRDGPKGAALLRVPERY
jgi:hypothetical protein